jgi:hypothetical protein
LTCDKAAGQKPAENVSHVMSYGKITGLQVFAETLSTVNVANNMTSIMDDIRHKVTEFNTDETFIFTPASVLYLTAFIADDWEYIADTLIKVCSLGDGAYNPWVPSIIHSENTATPNGKPLLSLQQQLAITDYDYAASLREMEGSVSLAQDFNEIWNWIIVQYNDANGKQIYVTPDDDANLKSAVSITAYGQRDMVLNYGQLDATAAVALGRRYLAQWKDPQWKLSGPITVKDHVRGKAGQIVPASEIVAGKRIKIEDFQADLIMLISQTTYSDTEQTCSITCGIPDNLATWVARMEQEI